MLHLSRTRDIDHHLVFKAVSLSAGIGYQVPAGRLLIEPKVGVVADLFSTTGGTTNFNARFEEEKGKSHFDNSMQFRITGGLQLGYSLNEKYNVFVHSEYQQALTEINTSEKFYSEKNQHAVGGYRPPLYFF